MDSDERRFWLSVAKEISTPYPRARGCHVVAWMDGVSGIEETYQPVVVLRPLPRDFRGLRMPPSATAFAGRSLWPCSIDDMVPYDPIFCMHHARDEVTR